MPHRTGVRSWLFVPGDSEKKLAKVAGAGADAVIIDLEDAVAPDYKPVARAARAATGSPRTARSSSKAANTATGCGSIRSARPLVARGPRRGDAGRPARDRAAQGERAGTGCSCSAPRFTSSRAARHRSTNSHADHAAGERDAGGGAVGRRLCRLDAAAPRGAELGRRGSVDRARRRPASATSAANGPTPSAWSARPCCSPRTRSRRAGDRHAPRRFRAISKRWTGSPSLARRRVPRHAGDPSVASAGDQRRLHRQRRRNCAEARAIVEAFATNPGTGALVARRQDGRAAAPRPGAAAARDWSAGATRLRSSTAGCSASRSAGVFRTSLSAASVEPALGRRPSPAAAAR